MSRTIRRKNCNNLSYSWIDEKYYTHTDRYIFENGHIRYVHQERKPGKQYKKGWWKFHSDHLVVHKIYRYSWGMVRAKNRDDLAKWIKDQDYEVMFYEDVNKRDWSD